MSEADCTRQAFGLACREPHVEPSRTGQFCRERPHQRPRRACDLTGPPGSMGLQKGRGRSCVTDCLPKGWHRSTSPKEVLDAQEGRALTPGAPAPTPPRPRCRRNRAGRGVGGSTPEAGTASGDDVDSSASRSGRGSDGERSAFRTVRISVAACSGVTPGRRRPSAGKLSPMAPGSNGGTTSGVQISASRLGRRIPRPARRRR